MTTDHIKTAIIGAGISGLATSKQLNHEDALIFEASDHYAGHVHSEFVAGGPHALRDVGLLAAATSPTGEPLRS